MPGRIIHTPTKGTLHDRSGCHGKPRPDAHPPGTIWQCDECNKKWVVVTGSQYNEQYTAWRILTDQNRNGQDR